MDTVSHGLDAIAKLVDVAPVLITAADRYGRIVLFNEACEQLTGFRRQDVVGQPFIDTLVPPEWRDIVQQRFAGESPAALRAPHVNPWQTTSGEIKDIEWHCFRQTDVPDSPWIVGFGHDLARIAVLESDLQASNRAKDEFLAAIAHELRQPLNACLGAVAMMKIRQNRETGERAREVLERQLVQMTRLIEDLLDTSHVARGTIRLRKLHVDLRDLVQRAREAAQPILDARNHTCAVFLPDTPVNVNADAMRLQQILGNLLANAAKYTDPGGHIVVNVTPDADTAKVSVRDNGHGIPKDVQQRIFGLFARATTEGGGFGIGLAVVRRLVEAHGGSVAVVSEGTGRGSEFVITLPRPVA